LIVAKILVVASVILWRLDVAEALEAAEVGGGATQKFSGPLYVIG
jgi:hypothetical protein